MKDRGETAVKKGKEGDSTITEASSVGVKRLEVRVWESKGNTYHIPLLRERAPGFLP